MIKCFERPEPLYPGTVSGKNFGHDRLKSECFKVQPVTGCDLSIFLYIIQGIFYMFFYK